MILLEDMAASRSVSMSLATSEDGGNTARLAVSVAGSSDVQQGVTAATRAATPARLLQLREEFPGWDGALPVEAETWSDDEVCVVVSGRKSGACTVGAGPVSNGKGGGAQTAHQSSALQPFPRSPNEA